ncbi:hypothetical protein ACIA8O_26800 [Kitasatospora sp. NPDC051853]|uniref:hypothetical protein n=1 Tax=Kitasatospora sp. NPDC051853 TaxID=3364058 RepID=UPI0037BBCEA0
MEVLTGSGWYDGTVWSGPDRTTVTTDREVSVVTLDPATGRPSGPVVTRRQGVFRSVDAGFMSWGWSEEAR